MNNYQEIMKDVDGVLIPFSSNWNKVAIGVSGGADSALLAYILCDMATKECEHFEMHVISHTRCWKTKPWQHYDSINVFNYLVEKFPNIHFKRYTNFIAPELEWGTKGRTLVDEYDKIVSGDNIEQRAFAEFVSYTENVNAYFNAVTRNPKNVNFIGLDTRDVDPDETNKHLSIMEHMGRLACHPFRFVEKDWVIKQYKNKNLMELFELTRSCEGTFNGLDYQTFTPGTFVPTCGICFWCLEREWAIEQNK